MHNDEPGWPLIDDFFHVLAQGRRPATVRRYARVRSRLYTFLDTGDMTLGLGPELAVLLDAEREFHVSGAFWSLFGVNELLSCLPSFLHESWWPEGATEARAHVSTTGRLVSHLRTRGGIHGRVHRGVVLEAEAAVTAARRDVERHLAATAADDDGAAGSRMPNRFRQPPGPRW